MSTLRERTPTYTFVPSMQMFKISLLLSVHLFKVNILLSITDIKNLHKMNHVMRKPAFCTFENKGADQLCGNCTADQRLCFRYIDRTMPLLPKSELSRL